MKNDWHNKKPRLAGHLGKDNAGGPPAQADLDLAVGMDRTCRSVWMNEVLGGGAALETLAHERPPR